MNSLSALEGSAVMDEAEDIGDDGERVVAAEPNRLGNYPGLVLLESTIASRTC